MKDFRENVPRARDLPELGRELLRSALFARFCAGRRPVLGEGNPRATLVLVGEAPGGQEERAGRPFVGPAGRILDEAMASAGLEREALWITNVLKCRPTAPGAGGRLRNRPPTGEEVSWFLPWLRLELELVRPQVIACLGATACSAVLGRSLRITRERGSWFDGPGGVPAVVTYHPAYLLRRTGDRDARYAEFAQDLHAAAVRAGLASD